MKAKGLIKHIKQFNGATLDNNGDILFLKSGYMVSAKGHEKQLKLHTLNDKLIKDYLRLAKKLGGYVGLWYDNSVLYIDISYCESTLESAFAVGRKNRQKAIYDNANATTIYLK